MQKESKNVAAVAAGLHPCQEQQRAFRVGAGGRRAQVLVHALAGHAEKSCETSLGAVTRKLLAGRRHQFVPQGSFGSGAERGATPPPSSLLVRGAGCPRGPFG